MKFQEIYWSGACRGIPLQNKGQIITSRNFYHEEKTIMPGKPLWALEATLFSAYEYYFNPFTECHEKLTACGGFQSKKELCSRSIPPNRPYNNRYLRLVNMSLGFRASPYKRITT